MFRRLAKHLLATALDQVNANKELGHCSSVIRQALITLLWDSTKESDQKLIQVECFFPKAIFPVDMCSIYLCMLLVNIIFICFAFISVESSKCLHNHLVPGR